MGARMKFVIFAVAVFGIAVLCVLAVSHQPSKTRVTVKNARNFEQTFAEGMRMWNPKTGVDIVRFDACRIEDMKIGMIRLGAFSVLCLDGLVLNLPLPAEEEDSGVKSEECKAKSGGLEAADALAGLLPRSFLQQAGVPTKSFSGIEINGLAVNRVENRRTVPVFAADVAKNRGRTLVLENCRVFEPGRTNGVGTAYLELQPAPALVWEGGMRKLDDLFPNFSETKN